MRYTLSMKQAGMILDYYDDRGALVKEKFPQLSDLPDVIKTASVKPAEKLPNEAFALLALDSGTVLRKFACYDPGTTAMSVMYFMEHGYKLPKVALTKTASNLARACQKFGLLAPKDLLKTAGLEDAAAVPEQPVSLEDAPDPALQQMVMEYLQSLTPEELENMANQEAMLASQMGQQSVPEELIDVTGQEAEPKVAALSSSEQDYAVITSDGRKLYPIHDWDHLKLACDYWALESRRMDPELRRQFAVKTASKAVALGYPIHDSTLLASGVPTYVNADHVKTAMEMRKVALPGADHKEDRQFLDELFTKTATLHPEVFAECVRRFDVQHGLDKGWDHVIPSPWESTFGIKTAAVVWEQGADRVTDEALINLARNSMGVLKQQFTEDFLKGFEKDPVGVFESMPLPHKRSLARFANDTAAQGSNLPSANQM